jgi:hypothetical protein
VTLSLDQRLHPTDLTCDVLYHTHYSTTGWGKRSLSANEVGIAFGWPAWARKGSADLLAAFPSVPLQIMDGCLKGITSTAPRLDPLKTPALPVIPVSAHFSWIPLIQKFLPHTWVDSGLVTAKAAKRDDAGVPTHLWDRRCSLVLPHTTPVLDNLRRLIMWVATT